MFPDCKQGHASLKEHRRAEELRLLERAGEIRNLHEQVRIPLCECPKPLIYVADWTYEEPYPRGRDGWRKVIEDCKGGTATQTPVFKLKKHLLEDQGMELRIT